MRFSVEPTNVNYVCSNTIRVKINSKSCTQHPGENVLDPDCNCLYNKQQDSDKCVMFRYKYNV